MKRRCGSSPLAAALLLGLFFVAGAATGGCGHSQGSRRGDWRQPSQVCATDAECPSGTCAIDNGAGQGTCTPGTLPALPPAGGAADGGASPSSPGPSIQPSSSDVRI